MNDAERAVFGFEVDVFAEVGEVLSRRRRGGPFGWLRRRSMVLEDLFGACADPPGCPKWIRVSPWDSGRVRVRSHVAADAAGEMFMEWLSACERRSLPGMPSTSVIDDALADVYG